MLALCTVGVAPAVSGCGSILYPERRGQPKGQLDWGVVALDGLALLLFVVPGVIAFAVDFSTGAIYLPSGSPAPEGYSSSPRLLRRLRVGEPAATELTDKRLAEVLAQELGRPVVLDQSCRRMPLRSLDEFWSATDRLLAEANSDRSNQILRAQSSKQD